MDGSGNISAAQSGDVILTEIDLYLTPAELCARYKGAITERTLANWRSNNEGPQFTKIGGKVLYSKRAVLEWEKRRTR